MSELNNALTDYLVAVIATKQREEEKRSNKGLSSQDHEMIARGFKRAQEIEAAMDETRNRNRLCCVDGVWYCGDVAKSELEADRGTVLPRKPRVQGNAPTKPKAKGSSDFVPSAAATAAAEIFSRIYSTE